MITLALAATAAMVFSDPFGIANVTRARAADKPAAASASSRTYEPAAIRAAPGLQCTLYPPGSDLRWRKAVAHGQKS
jgi:hypothetical protein